MTQILLHNSIDNMQMNVLIGLFNSWDVVCAELYYGARDKQDLANIVRTLRLF